MARPTKYSAEMHKAIIAELEIGCSRTTAAELNGITRQTFNDWAGTEPNWDGKYSAFSYDVRAAMAKAKKRATITIVRSIRDGDVASAWRYLAMQERAEWREQNDLNVNHTGTINHNHRDLSAFRDDEIDALSAVAERVKAGAIEP